MSPSTHRPARIEPGIGEESVWDYPRPPRLEPARARLRVVLGGVTIADTVSGWRVVETSHPPNYYFPPADIRSDALISDDQSSWCEWKGQASYHTVRGADRVVRRAAWSYPHPDPAYAELAGMVAFCPALMDACFVDDERVRAQPGGFYGGWITRDVAGPFKGAPGTDWW
jgi:uncharacterized protein (DUF427 family)